MVPLLRCGSPTDTAGTTNTGNARVAAVYPDHSPAANALVRLRPADYTADTVNALAKSRRNAIDIRTDNRGLALLQSIGNGSYTIEITDETGNAAMVGCRVDGGDAVIDSDTATLRPFAVVSGTAAPGVYIRVAGLERVVRVGADSLFEIDDLPAGTHRLNVVSGAASTVLDSIATASGDTTTVRYASWRHSCRVVLNTTERGADTPENVIGFPLLIRLDSSLLDFSEAAPGGSDVRFTGPDFTALPYEIEQWDTVAALASIWVRVDTVYGNNDRQFVRMFWGNPGAESQSNGAAVFDSADGWCGVWHMSAAPGGAFPDASGRRGSGRAEGFSVDRQSGIIGGTHLFDGIDDRIRIESPAGGWTADTFTVSAWIRLADAAHDHYHRIVTTKRFWSDSLGFSFVVNPAHEIGPPVGTQDYLSVWGSDSLNFARAYDIGWTASTWYHVCAVVVDDSVGIYRDAEYVIDPDSRSTKAIGSIKPTTRPLFIGGNTQDMFKGGIDEVRLTEGIRSNAWIKLTYENQRREQSLVRFHR